MASEIRVDKINSRSGVGTVTLSPTGVDISGITTVSTLKVGTGLTASSDGDVFFTGVATATTFSGSGASLTGLPAAQLSGTLPAISAANLTNVPAANITGTLPAISAANLTNVPAANLTGVLPALNAASLTSINAAQLVGVCTSGLTKTGGFGKVLQVVTSGIDNGEHMIATSSTSYVTDANLPQATITPISSSSDILIIAHIGMQHDGTDQIENTIYREVSGASAVDLSASNTYGLAFSGVNGAQIYNGCYINVTDTGRPSGTTQTTYKWYGRSEFGAEVKLRHKSSVCMTLVEFEP